MSIDAVLEGLVQLGEDDWIALWMISQDVEELLGVEDPNENLEVTITVVKALLERGFRAGESPAVSTLHFVPWTDQDPEKVCDLIRRQWLHRGTLPAWGDSPWFCSAHFGQVRPCLN